MDVNAAVIREQFAEQDKPTPEKFDELRAEHLVAVGLLLVLHEVLLRGKRRVDVDEPDLAARAEAVRSLLVGNQFAQGQQVVAPHEQIAPAVRVRPFRAELADELPGRGRRLRQNFLALQLPRVFEPVFLPDLLRPRGARKQPMPPLFRQWFSCGDEGADRLPLRVVETRHGHGSLARESARCLVTVLRGNSVA